MPHAASRRPSSAGLALDVTRRVIAEAMGVDHLHLTAEEVLERARGRLPEVSPTTEYNRHNELVSMARFGR
jgi:Fur family transcriptional regulator, stress-responsive regulator